jgi:hypothetical protein
MNILEFFSQNKEIAAALSSLITGAAAAVFRYIEKGKLEQTNSYKIENLEQKNSYKIENLERNQKHIIQENENLVRMVNFQRELIQYFLDKNEKENT